jgi:hypothetical protein
MLPPLLQPIDSATHATRASASGHCWLRCCCFKGSGCCALLLLPRLLSSAADKPANGIAPVTAAPPASPSCGHVQLYKLLLLLLLKPTSAEFISGATPLAAALLTRP